jgi:hypothetical protein
MLHPLEIGPSRLGAYADPPTARPGLRPLGQTDAYPIDAYSADTLVLQQAINKMLTANGYAGIGLDGKLYNETCGAIGWLVNNGLWTAAPVPVTVTMNCSGLGGGWAPTLLGAKPTTPVTPAKPPAPTPAAKASGSGSGVIAALFGGVLGLGVLAVIAERGKKKRRRR